MSTPPLISVVIPAYGYAAGLDRLLAALSRQAFNPPFEVIVVDDGSEIPLEPVAIRYRDVLNLRYVRLPNGGPARARNTGARAAQGEWIAFTDHDCEPAPDWLAQALREGEISKGALLGGSRVTGPTDNDWAVAHDMLCAVATRWRSDGKPAYFSTENLVAPRDRFLEIGGFDERFSFAHEDREFCARWLARGFAMRPAPAAVVRHSHNFTARSFCRQHFRFGACAVDYRRIGAGASEVWTMAMRFDFYASLLRYPWKTLKPGRAWRISAILALSQVVYASGYYSALLASRFRGNLPGEPGTPAPKA